MVTSSDFTQQQVVPMSKHQAAIRHMRKNVEEQKRQRLEAKIAMKKMLNKKDKKRARMEMEMQKLQEEKEERERTANDYETCFL